jgi:hypothetical protein
MGKFSVRKRYLFPFIALGTVILIVYVYINFSAKQPHEGTKPKPSKISAKNSLETSKKTSEWRLFGMRLGESKQAFIDRFGLPKNEYFTEGEEDSLFVYAYDQFDVGFNQQNKTEFIILRVHDADPDLFGIKIGSSVSQVLRTLGPADQQTSYVLTYTRNHSILKLDIDIELQTIISIKLFRANESYSNNE